MRRLFYTDTTWPASVGLLLLRLVVGAAFLFHGWPKIHNPMGWMPPEANMPGFLQALAAVSEFGGGLFLIVGFFTRLASLGIIGTMVGALAIVHLPMGHPFVAAPGKPSFELAAVYLACALLFLLAGPGRLSLDGQVFASPSGPPGEGSGRLA